MKQEKALDKYLQGIGLPPTLQLPFYTGPAVEVTNGILLACRHKNDWPEARKLLLRLLRLPNEPRYLKLGQGSRAKIVNRISPRNKSILRRIGLVTNCLRVKEKLLEKRKYEENLWTFYATPCARSLNIDTQQSPSFLTSEMQTSQQVSRGIRSTTVPHSDGVPSADDTEWFPDMDTKCPLLSRAPSVSKDVELPVSHTVDVTPSCHATSQMASTSEDMKPTETSALDVTSLLPVAKFSWPVTFSEASEDVKPPVSPVHEVTSWMTSGSGNVTCSMIPEESKPGTLRNSVSTQLESRDTSHPSASEVVESVTDPLPSFRSRSSTPFTNNFSSVPFIPCPQHRFLEHKVEKLKIELEQKNKRNIELQSKVKAQNEMLYRKNIRLTTVEDECKAQKQLIAELNKKQLREAVKEKKEYTRNEMKRMSDSLEHALAKIEKLKAEAASMRCRADEAEEKLCEMEDQDQGQKKLMLWDKQQKRFSDHRLEYIVRFSKLGLSGKKLPAALECAASFVGVKLDRTPCENTCRRATQLVRARLPEADSCRGEMSPDAEPDCGL